MQTLFKVTPRTQVILHCICTGDSAWLVQQHPQKDESVLQPSLTTRILHASQKKKYPWPSEKQKMNNELVACNYIMLMLTHHTVIQKHSSSKIYE